MAKLLLHICCGVCGLEVIERLKSEYQNIVLFFYNPNIFPEEEYKKRLAAARQTAKLKKVKLTEGPYDTQNWFSAVSGLENEPEGGRRCEICFGIRLEKTARLAKETGCDRFATTLSISPHKSAEVINRVGESLARKYDLVFLAENFKKKDGFKKTMTAAKKHKIWRQNYCGCLFSHFAAIQKNDKQMA